MIALGSDHGGFPLKQHVKEYLDAHGLDYVDYGCADTTSCDYPVYAKAAAEAVASGKCERGIVICTTGVGISIAANKVKGIRHNDANMLAMGAGVVGPNLAERIVETFLTTEFEGGRHQRRVDLITDMEK